MVMRQFKLIAARAALTPTIPDAPTLVNATLISDNDVRVDWVDNSNNETGFKIYRNVSGGAYSLVQTTAPNIETWQDNNLTYDLTYCWKVSAVNDTGESDQVGPDCVAIPEDPGEPDPPCAAPDAPSIMAASTATSSSISLSWTDNSDDETSFEIYMDGLFEKSVAAGSTSTTVSGLAEGTSYTFKVRAVKTTCSPTAYSGFSNSDSAYTKLASPDQFLATAQSCSTELTWNVNSGKASNQEIYKGGALYATVSAGSSSRSVHCATGDAASTFKVRAIHSTIPDSGFSGSDSSGIVCDGCIV